MSTKLAVLSAGCMPEEWMSSHAAYSSTTMPVSDSSCKPSTGIVTNRTRVRRHRGYFSRNTAPFRETTRSPTNSGRTTSASRRSSTSHSDASSR